MKLSDSARQQYRHEEKYFLNLPEAAILRTKLKSIMKEDTHAGSDGEYFIRSLYFDDYFNSAYREKDAGVLSRKKYRIRIYNCSDDFIAFERKTKNDRYICKESVRITRDECDRIIEGDYAFLEKKEEHLLNELYYEFTGKLLRPKVVVDYEREPFLMDEGTVRITFDKHVRGSDCFDIFEENNASKDAVPGDKVILEVKYTEFFPQILRDILPPRTAENSAISKFVLCTDILRNEGEMKWTR